MNLLTSAKFDKMFITIVLPTKCATPRAKRMCLVALLDVRNAISLCLHFCYTNNRIIISFLRVQMHLLPEKGGVRIIRNSTVVVKPLH